MSQRSRAARADAKRHTDTPADPWMQTGANCTRPAISALALANQDGSFFSRPIPLCAEHLDPITHLYRTDAGFGALVALTHNMEQRTGQPWIYEDEDDGGR